MKKIIILASLLFAIRGFSQNTVHPVIDSTKKMPDSSFVVIHKDPRVDLLIKKQAQINEETTRESRKTAKGYRLMIISTINRDEAIAAKTTVYTYFPELKAYLWHQSPYYKLKAGNFKDRKEAEDYQKRMNVYFPKGVFIMNDIVEVKPDKSRDDSF
jgi:hypothetical protein